MPVCVIAANGSLVNLDNAAKLFNIFHKRHADFVAHAPSGFVGTKAHVAHDLQCAHALFAGEHKMGNAKPFPQGLVGILEDGPDQNGEAVAIGRALMALPMPLAGSEIIDTGIAAAGAADAFRPAPSLQIGPASVLVREHVLELLDGELVDRLGALGHGNLPTMEGCCHG
jgi:hypothetical protein